MKTARAVLLSLAAPSLLTACAGPAPSEAELAELIDASVKATVHALADQPPTTATPLPSQTPTHTSTPTATVSLTPTPVPPNVSVSLATNCRTGPSISYPYVLSFRPGQVAHVTARSTVENYWYIANPEQGDEHCWLWGEYATLEGDVGSLPVLTPEPSPVPQMDFTLYRHSFSECGSKRVNLIVINNSGTTFKSARLQVEDLTASNNLHGPSVESSPFADNPSSCPSDKSGTRLRPGETAYIIIPLHPFDAGNNAAAYVRLCTRDDGTGSCVTKSAYFQLPGD